MNIVDNLKEIADLIKKFGDIELYRKIVELEGEVIELTRKIRSLEEKNVELERQLSISKEMTFKNQLYFMSNDDVPFCPKCWDYDKKTVHLVKPNPLRKVALLINALIVKTFIGYKYYEKGIFKMLATATNSRLKRNGLIGKRFALLLACNR